MGNEGAEENEHYRNQVEQFFLFDPDELPVCKKDFHMIQVFCDKHVRLEDLDDKHCFVRDVEYEASEGPISYKTGEKTTALWSYVEDRKQSRGVNPDTYKLVTIWGQPKAWVDI